LIIFIEGNFEATNNIQTTLSPGQYIKLDLLELR